MLDYLSSIIIVSLNEEMVQFNVINFHFETFVETLSSIREIKIWI